ncbi:aminotransferase class IV [Hyphomonas sp. FCG-A18]|uniref:aminotransferase class IV n=1 Tax=Hyphomonas sp. FCG-A18 TaxID=3080019 RepID=UPI002B31EB21|nr:aminotransferase class IV [Hyphomonas sp. FCG-A18]
MRVLGQSDFTIVALQEQIVHRSNYSLVLSASVANMSNTSWVYVNGDFVPAENARISPFDRGFLFGQAAYEVTAVYNGKLIDFEGHLARLSRTLAGIEIAEPDVDLASLHQEIMTRNNLTEGLIYLQVTGGVHGPRDFYGPEELTPGLFMFATHKTLIGDLAQDGITAISIEDTRWKRRDMKTTQLLSQTLAYREARRAGAHTAIMHEDGFVTEAASANTWIVGADETLVTRDLSRALLPGITRRTLADLLRQNGLRVEERAYTLEEMFAANEAFISSTGVVIAPILSIDQRPIGTGQPGPVTRQVQQIYYDYLGADTGVIDWL